MGAYKFVPELWLKKQPLKKQYDVMRFLQMFSEHHHKPIVPGKPPQTDCKIKQSYIVCLGSQRPPHVQRIENMKEFCTHDRYVAMLDEDEAAHISKHPNVQFVSLRRGCELLTTHSWVFLGSMRKNGSLPNASIWQKSLGEDVIIANIDTGVWPESESFSDEGMGPIPAKWRGSCQTDSNNSDNFHCNKKLIGAKYFYQHYESDGGSSSFTSPRDYHGHGTHTLATAGGNFVPGASSCGLGKGMASGGSPRARVASYKVSWPNYEGRESCDDADMCKAYSAAIDDGVDVLSVSMGGEVPDMAYMYQGSYKSTFEAVTNGIVVVKAAGNTGPRPSSLSNCEPWVITVAASTTDRDFFCDVTLGDNRVLKGKAFNNFGLLHERFYPLASGADVKYHHRSETDAMFCERGALDPNKAKGKILFCFLGGSNELTEHEKAEEAHRVGAIGLILGRYMDLEVNVVDDQDVFPTAHVNYRDAVNVLNYIKYNRYPVAHISKVKTKYGIEPAPYVASFSSRGPNSIDPAILKPDITAPGVGIIAAYGGSDCGPFIKMSGTSMACPHVAGVAALLRSIYPRWSPAAIKSAIMTTASVTDTSGSPMMQDDSTSWKSATPFAYGAGQLQPNLVVDPGLIYDITTEDYLNYLWHRGAGVAQLDEFYKSGNYKPPLTETSFNILDFNYPAITVPYIHIGHPVVLTRIVENVGCPGKYRVKVIAPSELGVVVEPQILEFQFVGEKKQFRVILTLRDTPKMKDYVFGRLIWIDGKHKVNTPIIVRCCQ